MKSALFVQANVAVNTKLTSKVPFLFGNFDVFKKILVKNVQFRYGMTGNMSGKYFLGALVNIPKCPWKPVRPQSFDASYAPARQYSAQLIHVHKRSFVIPTRQFNVANSTETTFRT
jgi:hypothetical protein